MLNGPWRPIRVGLAAADAFVAFTAIGGGMTLAVGIEGDRFPTAWLAGTPFNSYLGPGLILALVVGGSAAAALVASLRDPTTGAWTSTLAGVVLIGWILGEIAMLTGDGEFVSPTEAVYLVVGAAMVVLGHHLARPRAATRSS